MPSQRSSKPTISLPAKKAKVGAILSGIASATPGVVQIGSIVPTMNLLGSSGFIHEDPIEDSDSDSFHPAPILGPAPAATSTSAVIPSLPTVALGTFCHFCLDSCSPPHQHECVECGAIVCEQFVARSSGCIFINTVEAIKGTFLCPMCSRTAKGEKDRPLRYVFIGFGKRIKVKLAWPMAIVNLSLESMKDDYLASAITLEAQNHYRSHPENLYVSALRMRGAAHMIESRKLAPGIQFCHRNIVAGFPPNVFVVVDTHSDEFSGMLQHTGGHTGGTNATITEILKAYLGKEFVTAMKASADAARNDTTVCKTFNGKAPWCDVTAKARGGRRGLFMVSCGPAIRVSHHFEEVKALVDSDVVDFVLAFGGSGTLPSMISNTVRSFMMEMGVFGRKDVWEGLCQMLATSNDFLEYTTAVVVYSSYLTGQRTVECRQITKDSPGVRAFGFEFKACATPGCHPSAADMRVFNKKGRVQLRCLKCGWRSAWVKTDQDNDHFQRVHKIVAPTLFWHHFPPSTGLQNFFVEVSKPNPEAAASASTTVSAKKSMGHKGVDKKGKGKRQPAADIKEDAQMIYISDSDSDSDAPMVLD
ncbi:hypothetical protein BDR05DRAFT_953664 [Suillus weaverae]|nr:hypothetical protein BDR05DRAFT_953664 [Suillus weaverae]